MNKKYKNKPRTQPEAEDLIARLDELVAKSDSSVISQIEDFKIQHSKIMSENFGRHISQFNMYFSCLVDYSRSCNYVYKKWTVQQNMQFLIATRGLKQLYNGNALLIEGMYEDSLAVLRSVYESLLRIVFISCNPQFPYNSYGHFDKKGPKFIATNLVKDMGLEWIKYNITSSFAHSNKMEIMKDVFEISKNKKPKLITLTYKADEDLIGIITNLIQFLTTWYLLLFERLLKIDVAEDNANKKEFNHLINTLKEYSAISFESLSTHNDNEYYRKSAEDIMDITELMCRLDAKKDLKWKEEWSKIRSA